MNSACKSPRRLAAVRHHAGEAAALLKALASDRRLTVLCHLLGGPLSVGEINARVPLSQSALSQHLGVLRAAGLVGTKRQSQTVYYALAAGPALDIVEILHARFCAPKSAPERRGRRAAGH
ncbi:MAG TPA: metalloregulator ArsR/SmtB family transcription factor [Steroidobacteraceae bacterium]|nr:metalloregulator ArsR/SmtB family transcription factor [Steroidobacteraceae bacterium]